jgi:uncharacterized membrane protein
MQVISTNDRWLSSVCYMCFLVLIPIFLIKDKSTFLIRHCQQGFALLMLEIVLWLVLSIIDSTIGAIPLLGLLISFVLHFAGLLIILALSVIGFVKGLSGESWTIPFIDDIADKVPVK